MHVFKVLATQHVWTLAYRCRNPRPHRVHSMTMRTISTQVPWSVRLPVCLSVCVRHIGKPWKKGSADRGGVWDVDSGGPRNHVGLLDGAAMSPHSIYSMLFAMGSMCYAASYYQYCSNWLLLSLSDRMRFSYIGCWLRSFSTNSSNSRVSFSRNHCNHTCLYSVNIRQFTRKKTCENT